MTQIPQDDPTTLPWDYPEMVFCSGRYYAGMVMLPFARIPGARGNGGDMTGLLWRFEATPEDWVFTYRFRYYAGPNNGAWDGRDRKSWYAIPTKGTEATILNKITEMIPEMTLGAAILFGAMPLKPKWFLIHGDSDKAGNMLMNNPPSWMHRREIAVSKDGKPTKVTTGMTDEPNQ